MERLYKYHFNRIYAAVAALFIVLSVLAPVGGMGSAQAAAGNPTASSTTAGNPAASSTIASTPEASNTAAPAHIKVGFFKFAGYHDMDEHGIRSGYGYDFIQMIARYDNDEYEYVGYDRGWENMLSMLDNGEIDILTNVALTPERQEKYLYSSKTIGNDGSLFTVRDDNSTVIPGEYATYDGIVVGSIKDSVQVDEFARFAEQNHFTYSIKTYGTEAEMEQALDDGEVEGIVSIGLRNLQNEKVIEQISKSDMYVITRKENTELMAKINRAIDRLDQESYNWRSELFDKYYHADQGDNISFLTDELEYIEKLNAENYVLRVAVNPDRKPYSYYENGTIVGIIPRIFDEVARRIGLNYEIQVVRTRDEYQKLLSSGNIDACLDDVYSMSEAENDGYKLTDPYLSASLARIVAAEFDGTVHKTAILKDADMKQAQLKELLGNTETVACDTTSQCIEAVKQGYADETFVYSYTVQIAQNEDPGSNLRINILMDYGNEFAIGVPRARDYHLLTILNKGINSIEKEYIQNIITDETDYQVDEIPLGTYLKQNPWVAGTGVALVLLILAVTCLLLARIHYVNRMKVEEENKNRILIEKAQQEAEFKSAEIRARERLEQALKRAQEADNAKSQFLSRMSHELRTPLNAMMGYTQMMKENIESGSMNKEQLLQNLTYSQRASRYLLEIIGDILDIQSIEAGKIQLKKEALNAETYMKNITDMICQEAAEKNISFQYDKTTNMNEEYILDGVRFQQILLNVLHNAVKFTPAGGTVTLKGEAIHQDDQTATLQFTIADTGIGMSREFMEESLFKRFAQENADITSPYDGCGTGLAISRQLLELMDGEISCTSEKGVGTTFVIRIRVEQVKGRRRRTAGRERPNYDLGGIHVLICEDNPLNQDMEKKLLEKMKCQVDIAEDGAIGLEMVERSAPGYYDAVLMDIRMPNMDGLEATRRIRGLNREDVKTMPILAVSANAFEEDVQKSLEAGMNEHLAKPVDGRVLYQKLKEYCGK